MATQTVVRNTEILTPTAEIFKYLPDGNVLSESVVLQPSTVTADAAGIKTLYAGTLIVKITATGEFGPYASGAVDGRQTLAAPGGAAPTCGILSMDVDLTDGAKAAGMYYGNCQFNTSKLTLLSAAIATVRAAMPSCFFL